MRTLSVAIEFEGPYAAPTHQPGSVHPRRSVSCSSPPTPPLPLTKYSLAARSQAGFWARNHHHTRKATRLRATANPGRLVTQSRNIKEIAKLRGSEDLWEELFDVRFPQSVNLRDWCEANSRWPEFIQAIPDSLLDLIDKCLTVNPRCRISAEEALTHCFFLPCHEILRKHSIKIRRDGVCAAVAIEKEVPENERPNTFLQSVDLAAVSTSVRARFEKMIRNAQDEVCAALEVADGTGKFKEDVWSRPGGGGGISRVLQDGTVFEKAGMNVLVVYGTMPPDAYRAAKGNAGTDNGGANAGPVPSSLLTLVRFCVQRIQLLQHCISTIAILRLMHLKMLLVRQGSGGSEVGLT